MGTTATTGLAQAATYNLIACVYWLLHEHRDRQRRRDMLLLRVCQLLYMHSRYDRCLCTLQCYADDHVPLHLLYSAVDNEVRSNCYHTCKPALLYNTTRDTLR